MNPQAVGAKGIQARRSQMISAERRLASLTDRRHAAVLSIGSALAIALLASTASFVVAVEPATADQVAPVRFAILGDRTGGHQPGIHGAIVQEIQRLRPDFVITVGDMIEGYVDDEAEIRRQWKEYKELVETLTMPLYYVSGNHDIWEERFAELYTVLSGAEPYYSFDVGDVHLLVLSTGPYDYVEDVPDDQIAWLVDDLEASRGADHTLVFFHKPYWIETVAAGEEDKLHDIFVQYGVDAVFTGHYHVYFSGSYDGIMYTTIGSSGGICSPGPTGLMYHYAWVTVGDDISIAPLNMGSVLPWEELTSAEFRFIDKIGSNAVRVEKVAMDADPDRSKEIVLTLRNLHDTEPISDTLRWEVPEGWSLSPAEKPLSVAPGSSAELAFEVMCTGSPYPTPTFTLRYPYGEGKTWEFEDGLAVTRTAEAVYAGDKRPVMDGKLDDKIWAGAVAHSDLFAPDGSDVVIEGTKFFFGWDEGNLYLAASCKETKIDSMMALCTERDGAVYGEDCVGYFIQPDIEDGPVYQVYFNPLGTAFDQKILVEDGAATEVEREWNGNYEVATWMGESSWSIEARIPLEDLGAVAGQGKNWALNFRRKQRRLNSSGDWLVPISYDPKDYGPLVMR
jgi:predicted phosphodiesterase